MKGDKYCPSNGTEGMWFIDEFCDHCIHEKWSHTQKDGDTQCEILSNSMVYDVKDEKYPKEWIYDENDNPTCTSHVPWDWGNRNDDDGLNEPPVVQPDDPNQMCLPFMLDEIENNAVEKRELEKV